jgi:hypothetical protein
VSQNPVFGAFFAVKTVQAFFVTLALIAHKLFGGELILLLKVLILIRCA